MQSKLLLMKFKYLNKLLLTHIVMESGKFSGIWQTTRVLCVPEGDTEEFLGAVDNSKLTAEFNISVKTDPWEALEAISNDDVDCIISGYDLETSNGINFLTEVRDLSSELPFMLITGAGDESVAERAIREGVTTRLCTFK